MPPGSSSAAHAPSGGRARRAPREHARSWCPLATDRHRQAARPATGPRPPRTPLLGIGRNPPSKRVRSAGVWAGWARRHPRRGRPAPALRPDRRRGGPGGHPACSPHASRRGARPWRRAAACSRPRPSGALHHLAHRPPGRLWRSRGATASTGSTCWPRPSGRAASWPLTGGGGRRRARVAGAAVRRGGRRFSRLAGLCLLVAAAGAYNALGPGAEPRGALDHDYGRVLLAKLALVAGLAALGAANRYLVVARVEPRRRAGPAPAPSVGRWALLGAGRIRRRASPAASPPTSRARRRWPSSSSSPPPCSSTRPPRATPDTRRTPHGGAGVRRT